jgi:Protein of unknown function (DUF3828)
VPPTKPFWEFLMRRAVLLLAVLLGLAPAAAAPADDPLTLIRSIYDVYLEKIDTGYADPYSARMRRLLDADAKNTPKGDAGKIDWDVFVDGNDWALTDLNIALVSRADTRARVRATFKNHNEPRDILFDLVREDGHWAIDDVASVRIGGRWTMSKILTGAPDAFPDEKK